MLAIGQSLNLNEISITQLAYPSRMHKKAAKSGLNWLHCELANLAHLFNNTEVHVIRLR